MKKVSDYRLRAEECRTLAAEARSQEHRNMLLDMATTWEALAKSRAKNVEVERSQGRARRG